MDERALLRTIDNLTKRIERLESQNRFTTTVDWMPANWWGRVSPTQPASRIVTVKGGWFWKWDGVDGNALLLPDTLYDFAAASAFTSTDAYRWVVVQADVSVSPPVMHVHEGEEFVDRADAENDFFNDASTDGIYTDYIPLAAIMLRNNGTTDQPGAVENVTIGDTEQSYMLVKDFRPWLHLHTA